MDPCWSNLGMKEYNLCVVILKSISLFRSCVLKQVYYMRSKVTEVEKEHYVSWMMWDLMTAIAVVIEESGGSECVGETQIKP